MRSSISDLPFSAERATAVERDLERHVSGVTPNGRGTDWIFGRLVGTLAENSQGLERMDAQRPALGILLVAEWGARHSLRLD